MSRPIPPAAVDGPEVLHGPLAVSRETQERLAIYVALLLRWQRAQNLVAPSTLREVWRRHVGDSIQVARLLPEARHWVDLGSGAGFPGLVTAILLMEEDAPGRVHLVESNQRKAGFLRAVIRETGCPAEVHAVRIEDLAQGFDAPVDAVSARALADLTVLCGYAGPFVARGATAIFHKGKNFREEITQASHAWDLDLVQTDSLIDPDSRLLMIRHIRPRRSSGKG